MRILTTLFPLLLAVPAAAQSFNIDYGTPGVGATWPLPAETYGGAANQPGTWVGIDDTTNFQAIPLTEISGLPTGVTVFINGGTQFGVGATNGPTADDANLLNDVQDPGPGIVTWTFSGLADGDYDIYTYAWAPDSTAFRTDVNVPSSSDGLQTVGGLWPGTHAQGISYALHAVTVAGGSDVSVEISTNTSIGLATNFGSMNGIQIVGDGMFAPSEFCNGDGGDQMGCTDCPCGNNAPQGTSGGCLNSAGTSTRILMSGTTSIASADLRFEASGAPPSNSAVLTSGNSRAPANMSNPCFGLDSGLQSVSLDGLRCAVQGVLRHGVRPSDANGDIGVTTNGWGTPNGFFNFGAFTAGQTKHFQIVHRDNELAVCGTGQNTSNGNTVNFVP